MYTQRLIKMKDPATERPLFATRCIELCCEDCKEAGKVAECVHLLHLVPSWQSEERHRKLKIMMCVCLFVCGNHDATRGHACEQRCTYLLYVALNSVTYCTVLATTTCLYIFL